MFIKILLKHTLKYLDNNDNLDKSIRTQVESTLKSVNRNELDLSKIDVLSLDSEIIRSILILFKNLLLIKRKFLLTSKFKKFLVKTTGSDDINAFRSYFNEIKRYKKLHSFKDNALKSICSGNSNK